MVSVALGDRRDGRDQLFVGCRDAVALAARIGDAESGPQLPAYGNPNVGCLEGGVNATKRVVASASKANATKAANGITAFCLRGTLATLRCHAHVKVTTRFGMARGVLLNWYMLASARPCGGSV